jgi:hypothetical protein
MCKLVFAYQHPAVSSDELEHLRLRSGTLAETSLRQGMSDG